MLLNYNLNITENSIWKIVTPNDAAKKFPFFINEAGHFICSKDYYTERKGQKNYFLMYTVSGCGYLKYKDSEYLLPKNTAVLINCNNYQYYKTHSEENWDYRWIHFCGNSTKNYYEIINGSGLSIITINQHDSFEEKFDKILKNIDLNDITSTANCTMYVNELLTICVSDKLNSPNKLNFKHRSEIEKVRSYITSNFKDSITLDDLCNLVYVSKYHFIKLFKTYTGFTPYEFLINHRVTVAKQLLKNTDLPINEISTAVGFNDESNFIKHFKEATHYTPLNYRRFF